MVVVALTKCSVEGCGKEAVWVKTYPLWIHIYCIKHFVVGYDDQNLGGVTTVDYYPEGIPAGIKHGNRPYIAKAPEAVLPSERHQQ
jgi:hypothetical protein